MKILIIQPRLSYFLGGGEMIPFEHAKYFSKLNHQVTIMTSKSEFYTNSEYYYDFKKNNPQIKFIELEIPNKFKYLYNIEPGVNWERWDNESLIFNELSLIYLSDKQNDFDLVAVHNIIELLAIPSSMKSVLHLHGYPSQLNYLCHLILQRNQNLISVSELINKKFVEFGTISKIETITNGIDEIKFQKQNRSKTYDLLFIGRLINIKGIDNVIKALKIITKINEFKNIQLAIAGKGPQLNELQDLTLKLGLEKNIKFLGFVSETEKQLLYHQSKIAILPSYDREGILTTLLEASASGTPVITTENTSMEEFVKHNITGLLCKAQDPVDLSNKILLLLKNESLCIKLSLNAYAEIHKNWTWDIKIEKLLTKYQEICNQN